jgi:hypothetical protein
MGRFSRYPAINRDPVEEEPVAAPAPPVTEPEVEVPEAPEVEEVVVDDTPAEEEVVAPEFSEDIDGQTTKEVLRWVGDDSERRAYALAREESGKARKTLLRKLRGA